MVSTEKRYKSNNFPVLRGAAIRGEYLYHIRLYSERAVFQSTEAGLIRMRMLLGFIEARAVVIDAIIRTEGTLHYLSVICSSFSRPESFSLIMKRTVPLAIIEEIEQSHAEEWITLRAVRNETWNTIPFSGAVRTVNESRRILVSLLLEYRALLAEYNSVMPASGTTNRIRQNGGLAINFLLFDQKGSICAIPDFQVLRTTGGSNGSSIIELQHEYVQRLIICDDLICIKEIQVADLIFQTKKMRGYYSVNAPVESGQFGFTLIVPAFL